MGRYSLERKNAVINKFHSDNTLSLSELARQESIPTSTLYNWLKQVNLVGNAMSKKRNSDNWSAETKLATVIETASLSEIELSAYCREKGLYPEQLAVHKDAKPRYGELPSFMKEIEPFDVSIHKDIVITSHKFSMRDFPNGLGEEFGCVKKKP